MVEIFLLMLVQIKRKSINVHERMVCLIFCFVYLYSGLIQPIFAERLRDMGRWLNINGEAIYDSQPWIYQNDTTTSNVWYTASSTLTNQRRNIFAIVLDYPYDSNRVDLYSVFGQTDENTTISILGHPDALEVGLLIFIKNIKFKFICNFSGALSTTRYKLIFLIRLN